MGGMYVWRGRLSAANAAWRMCVGLEKKLFDPVTFEEEEEEKNFYLRSFDPFRPDFSPNFMLAEKLCEAFQEK